MMEILKPLSPDSASHIFCQSSVICLKYSIDYFYCTVFEGGKWVWSNHRAFCPSFWCWLVRCHYISRHLRSLLWYHSWNWDWRSQGGLRPPKQDVSEISLMWHSHAFIRISRVKTSEKLQSLCSPPIASSSVQCAKYRNDVSGFTEV